MEKIVSFGKLHHGDKIISPVSNEVTMVYVGQNGMRYLAGTRSLFPCEQYNPEDYYIYTGDKAVGETDKKYFIK